MKKFVALMCALLMVLSMVACAGVTTNDDAKANATDDANDGATKSTVIADSNNDGQIEVGTVLLTGSGGKTRTEGHDKWHSDGPGGDAAGIKGSGNEILWSKEGKKKQYPIKNQQQQIQGQTPFGAHHGHHQKDAYANGYGQNKHQIGDGGDLPG